MMVITMLNQKGGVAKTTLTANLGGTWAKMGRRVLLIDNDPQASLSQGLLGPEATALLDPNRTIAGIYAGTVLSAEQTIRETAFPGLALLAGSEHASPFNNGAPHREPYDRQTCLRHALGELGGSYDLVLIDCPPNLNLCSWAALTASDAVLVPVQPEDYGAQGLPSVLRSIEAVRTVMGHDLKFLGLVISMIQPRRAIHQLYIEQLREIYGDALFNAMIPEAAEVAEATMQRKPICFYKPKGAMAKTLAALAAEIDGRIARESEVAA